MPSSSTKQAHMMAAAAHNPAFAKKVGIPVEVAADFFKADQRKSKQREQLALAAALRRPVAAGPRAR